jgi:hypothetical protein
VLISMGILTVGLLGVAALFPVGGFYMLKAEIADRGSAIAQSVMSDIMTKGMLNPRSWYVMVPPATLPAPSNTTFPSDGIYAPIPANNTRGTYSRPLALTLTEALDQPAAANDPTLIGKQFGSAFVLDPMGVAAMSFPSIPPSPWAHAPPSVFPATAYATSSYFYSAAAWEPWRGMWPVRRVTFRQPTGWQMDSTMAEHFFRGNDDLTTDLPERDDRPAQQNWDLADAGGGTMAPLARQWAGDYSWIVSVVPTTNAARDGMARNPEGHTYDVSVVVFYKRVLPADVQSIFTDNPSATNYANAVGANERAVKAAILSSGLNGGELLLTELAGNPESPFRELRTGQWIMLCGPHPNSNVDTSITPPKGEPRFALNWYQVISIESEGTGISGFDPAKQRVIAVRGPEWPWTPASNITDYNHLSNNLCVAICRGAVAVHTKTLRLEKSAMTFGESGSPKTTPPKWTP